MKIKISKGKVESVRYVKGKRKRKSKKRDKSVDVDVKESKIRPQNKHLKPIAKGQVLNPLGRPKGSRVKFAETFLKDFIADWEENGADAIADVREDDPSTYLRVAASLLPKELNLNKDESQLEKLLEQFSNEELDQFISAIAGLGLGAKPVNDTGENQKVIGAESTRIH